MQGIKQLLGHPLQPAARGSVLVPPHDDDEAKKLEEKYSAREMERLQRVIESLKEELGKPKSSLTPLEASTHSPVDEAQTQSKIHATQVQELFERFAEEQKATISATLKNKTEAMDEENELIEQRAKELEVERMKFTEAAVQLGRERAALEVTVTLECSTDLLC